MLDSFNSAASCYSVSDAHKVTYWKQELVCNGSTTLRFFARYHNNTQLPTGETAFYTLAGIAVVAPATFTLGACGSYVGSGPAAEAIILANIKTQLTAMQQQINMLQLLDSTPELTTAETVGLGNVDNIAAANLPVSIPQQAAIDGAVTRLVDGAPAEANTLGKQYAFIEALRAVVSGTVQDGNNVVDTVADVLALLVQYPEGVTLLQALGTKLDTSSVVNILTQTEPNRVLDARQGKVLNDLIQALNTAVAGKEPRITLGTSNQYYDGNKTFQNLTADVIADGVTKRTFTAAEKSKLEALTPYVLPVATAAVIGGVKAGTGVVIAADGTISAAVPAVTNSVAYVSSVSALSSFVRGNVTAAVVTDLLRGGVFTWVPTGVANDGTVFAANGGGFWQRPVLGAVNVKWFGAKGDASQNDSPFIQKAINYARTFNSPITTRKDVFAPAGYYNLDNTLDFTGASGIRFVGEGSRYVGTVMNAATSGIIVDMSGSSLCGISHMMLTSYNAVTSSTIGIQFALSKDTPDQNAVAGQLAGLNCRVSDVCIFMGNLPLANGGLGTVGIMNCRSEEFGCTDVMIQANTPAVFTTTDKLSNFTAYNHLVRSNFCSIQDNGVGSMGVVNWSGQCSLQAKEHLTPGMLLIGVNDFNYHGYMGRVTHDTGGTYETAVRLVNYTAGLKIHATIESYTTLVSFGGTAENCDFNINSANITPGNLAPVYIMDNGAVTKGSIIKTWFGNPNEMNGRTFMYTPPVGNGLLPTTAAIYNTELTASLWGDNTSFITPALLKQCSNIVCNTGQAFEKKQQYVSNIRTVEKTLAVINAGNPLITAPLIRFNNANLNGITTINKGGYYQLRVDGNIMLGQNTSNNAIGVAAVTGYLTIVQNLDGTYTQGDSNVVINSKTVLNPAYMDVSNIFLSFNGTDIYHLQLNINIKPEGNGSGEGVHWHGTTSLASYFTVAQSVIFE